MVAAQGRLNSTERIIIVPAVYDYIVVGAGSSGSIVAGKLSARPDISVLLIEAGGPVSAYPQVWDPNQINCLYPLQGMHWQGYQSTPLPHMNGRVMDVWRAKILGGCTAHNDMVYTRGAPGDYNDWERLYGCQGWSYAALEKHFAAVEAMLRPTTTTRNAFGTAFISACRELGLPYNPNYNSGASMGGVSLLQSTIDPVYRRTTSYETCVAPFVGRRPNLTVVPHALVRRIVFGSSRARGVQFSVGGEEVTAFVDREVILAAGAINTPKILMLSGVGDANELRQLGATDIVADLPGVGRNLQDAIIFLGTWSSAQPIRDQPVNEGCAIVWDNLTPNGQPETCIEMMRGKYTCNQSPATLEGHYSIAGGAMRLSSKGSVRLASLNPETPPVIDLNLLSHSDDYRQCLAAFQLMRKIGNSAGLNAWRNQELVPGPAVSTPEQIRQWILNNAFSYSHPSGTCAMGKVAQPVLDAELRVLGVQGVRVMDASIMPRITSGHTQGPAFMIGDKGADLLLQNH